MSVLVKADEPTSLYLLVNEEIDAFCRRFEEKIENEKQKIKACKKKSELDSKLAQEIKLHSELTQQLDELNRRSIDLERVCASFESLTITESDKNRLDNAKDTYQIAKDITGVRVDFNSPSNVTKGYVKNEAHKLLQAFEIPAGDVEGLWAIINDTTTQDWPTLADKEKIAAN